ncbi:MAG: endolytic transglycosylase MltG [Parcubacteria group bacterium]|nr:endolytic transglycosylase MltG [Parcubacteria group bacterium]
MKNTRKALFIVLVAAVIFAAYQLLFPLNLGSAETVFRIERGQGDWEIAQLLEREQFIRSAIFFEAYTFLRGAAGKLQAGDYVISPAFSTMHISNKLASGDVLRKRITIIEGWTVKDIAIYLEQQDVIPAKDILVFNDREGYLFPDTYEIPPGITAGEVVSMMAATFSKKVGDVPKDVVIIASILEREVRGLEDRRIVSGILQKRLRVGMALQVDATVNYITGKRDSQVSRADAAIDSPYNTYKYRGLPPGPISNPGLESIEAVLNPEESPYWYYLSTPEGKTIFSKTSEEHAEAKAQYLAPHN